MILFCLLSFITVLSDTPDSLVIKYSAEYKKNTIGDKVRYDLKDGGVFPEEKGFPALASVEKKILTPVKGKIELRYKVLSTRTEREIPTIIQRYGERETSRIPESYTPPPVTISENRSSPHGNAEVMINPFSFDGRNVKIRSHILIKIYFRGGKWISPRGYQRRNSHIFLNKIRGEKIRTSTISSLRQGAFLYVKLKTTMEGLYEVTPENLQEAGINPSSIDPEEIEILGGYDRIMRWEMDSLEAMDTLPTVLPAIYEVDGDGVFEEGERIIFFAHSLSGWSRNRFTESKFFYYHPYTDTNVYWLRFNGENTLEIEEISQTGGENILHFTDTLHLEEDEYSPLKSGLVWRWKELNTTGGSSQRDADNLQTTFNALNAYNSEAIIYVAFYPEDTGHYEFEISLNGESRSKTVRWQGNPRTDRTVFADTIGALNSGLNDLVVTLRTSEESIIMDYVEVVYERRLVASGDKLLITQDQSLIRNYTIEGFSRNPYLLDIADSRVPSLISHTFSNGNANFSTDSRKILLQSLPHSVEGISLADPTTLLQGGADWVVITVNQFMPHASRLKILRENHLRGIPSPLTKVVKIDDIYNNFSYGIRDPSAIKRFLYWTQENWNPPVSYVLLFGDGSYDDKNLTGIGKTSFIPIHTEGTTVAQSAGYLVSNPSCDSWFVDFNEDGRVPDIPIGRVTVSNMSEGKEWVDKLIGYESSTGDWRTRIILLADDAIKSGVLPGTEKLHTQYMEIISNLLPEWVYKDKVYLMEYLMESGTKPAAKQAHLESMEDGALAGFYLGHGNLRQLTDEMVLQIEDINSLSNWRKAPLYYFGSCDVGYFERPDEDCIASYSNLYKDGGNIVSIAAGRATGYRDNGSLGERIAGYLFNNSVPTAGDAFLFAMEGGGHKTYTFFGDPATSILIDSVPLNVTIPDTAVGGLQLQIRGEVHNSAEKVFCFLPEASYDTTLDATEGTGTFDSVTITKEGKTLFRGSAPVVNDSFVIKVNIPYDIEADSGRISLYSRGEKESYSSSSIYFVEGSVPGDLLPPSLEFKINDRIVRRGDLIPSSGEMILVIKDSSGVDLREKSNLQVIVNEVNEFFLADRFSYITGSSTTGEAPFSYKAPFSSDSISLRVYARDNAGNIANEEISFRIGKEELLWNVDNYPNPMRDKTVIVYNLSKEVSVEIKIFTIAGRLVKEIFPGVSRYGANYAEWDGRDKKGRKVSNGIYYYVIKAGDAEPYYGKIAVIR